MACPAHQEGFTLLEMIVVLVLIGSLTAMVAPGLERMYVATANDIDRRDLAIALNRLALDVRDTGAARVFPAGEALLDIVPRATRAQLERLDIQATVQQSFLVTAAGFCPSEGVILARQGERQMTLRVNSPDCRVR